jgi:glutamyl-tRNA synthetase
MSTIKLRFAPSPTGWLHVGNARIALANALYAKKYGGKLLLRYDDTDTERNRPEYTEGIAADLTWLGIAWDESFSQSSRLERYAQAAEILKKRGLLYPCFESDEELKAKREMRIKQGRAPIYDRAMLTLTPAQREAAEAGGKKPYWRFKLAGRIVTINDLVLGKRQIKLTAVSDPVLIRTDGMPLYTFTSVVDDIDSGITHIIRGEDHVTNTGVQVDLIEALGGRVPQFAHLPLLIDQEGGKLSKRLESLSLRSLRADGIEPEAVTGFLARLGTADSPEPGTVEFLAKTFDLARVSKNQPRFDVRQLLALNKRVLHEAPFTRVASRLPDGADENFWLAIRGNLDLLTEARLWYQVAKGDIDIIPLGEDSEVASAALATLPAEPWDTTTFKNWAANIADKTGRKGRALYQPLRLALTGEDHGPELATLLPLIGPARAAKRLRAAL